MNNEQFMRWVFEVQNQEYQLDKLLFFSLLNLGGDSR